ncbi:MAG TPA: hypothetical protein VG055_16815 [Planctomycetaceae bacterium]|jgi:hypothetical protein|nr:hypothetical protein [Planctomycetaceae bacterium]
MIKEAATITIHICSDIVKRDRGTNPGCRRRLEMSSLLLLRSQHNELSWPPDGTILNLSRGEGRPSIAQGVRPWVMRAVLQKISEAAPNAWEPGTRHGMPKNVWRLVQFQVAKTPDLWDLP